MEMTAEPSQLKRSSTSRRLWPVFALLGAFAFGGLTALLGDYVAGRIVLLGSIDAAKLVALLGAVTVWCLALAVIGYITKVAHGRFAAALGILVSGLVGLLAFALSLLVGLLLTIKLSVDPRYELDVPGSSSEYIVSTSTSTYDGEMSIRLYRGDGTVYEPFGSPIPYDHDRSSFEGSHRVETNSEGNSFLVYPQDSPGSDARIPLP